MREILDTVKLTCVSVHCSEKVEYNLREGDEYYEGVCPVCGQEQRRHRDSLITPNKYSRTYGNFLKPVKSDCLITFAPAGQMIALKRMGSARPVGGERGVVAGFSNSSRSRLMKKISQIKKGEIPLFVTLTYPSDFPVDREEYKQHLHAFFMVVRYHYPDYGAIWKLEFQARGAAHYHLLFWGVPFDDRDKIAKYWCQVVGSTDQNHLKWHLGLLGDTNSHCVQKIRSWGGVVSYAAKYMSKSPEVQSETGEYITGRIWGCRGKIPMSPVLEYRVDLEVALPFRDAVLTELGMDAFKRLGFWSFGFHPHHIILLAELEDYFNFVQFPNDDLLTVDLDDTPCDLYKTVV